MNTATQAWVAENNARQPERERFFNMVAPKTNWKHPINSWVPTGTDLDKVADACLWFGAGVATFEKMATGWVVKAPGYYATIGA
jgi:hypothetical protein